MMKKYPIIALLILLLCSFEVYAQSGWVLWAEDIMMKVDIEAKTVTPTRKWQLIEAYPNYNQCMAMKEREWERKARSWKSSGICKDAFDMARGDSFTCFFIKGGSLTVTFKCFPVTIDPREKE
jgi:hypothetical protein